MNTNEKILAVVGVGLIGYYIVSKQSTQPTKPTSASTSNQTFLQKLENFIGIGSNTNTNTNTNAYGTPTPIVNLAGAGNNMPQPEPEQDNYVDSGIVGGGTADYLMG